MKSRRFIVLLTAIAIAGAIHYSQRSVAADAPATFTGEKTVWYGFDRYDFLIDEATFALKPIKAAPDEKNGVNGQVPGQLRCVVVVPKEAAPDIPLLHACGSLDPILGNHTLAIEGIYQQLGGRVSVMIKEGAGHHPHSLRDPTPIADFIVHSLLPAIGASPAFAGKKFTRTSFYGVENSYRDYPKEGTYIGPH